MSGLANGGGSFWKWARDLIFIATVGASIWAVGQSIVRALDWIYVDLTKKGEAINALVTSEAQTKAIVDSHTKTLESIDRKLDRFFVPPAR